MTYRTGAQAHLWLLGFAYLTFVIYGSLVPLEFRAMPMAQAVDRFGQIPWLDLGIGSRADWVANLLLFIPLAFIFTGALIHQRSSAIRVVVSLLLPVVGLGLAVCIEFTQLFFPQRTVSQNDILAETLGGIIGVGAWWLLGPRLMEIYAAWLDAREPAALVERLAWAYVAVAFGYGVLPLDLTISGVEIYHKWTEGKLVLLPFSALPEDNAQAAYELFTDVLLWLPPALLWRLGATRARGTMGDGSARSLRRRSSAQVWRMTFGVAVLLEFLQLFVYSRITDISDLIAAALGAWLGVQLGARFSPGLQQAQPSMQAEAGLARWRPLLLALTWVPVMMTVFWYPFDFRADPAWIRERMGFVFAVPFEIYYFGTEFRAITSLFQKMLFFAPMGALLAWWVAGLPWLWRGYAAAASFVLITGVPLVIELGQVLLPEKHPDTTDWLLASLGGGLGYLLIRVLRRRWQNTPARKRPRMPVTRRAGHG